MLSEALAQQIASEISEVTGINILITDASGTVVGSGDTSRVGEFHEASVQVLRTGRSMAHGPGDVAGLAGSRPGLTVPLVVSGTAVGTVGLSGAPDDVRQFGMIVRRQTEILIRESQRIDQRLTTQRAVEDLIRDLFDVSRDELPPGVLRQRLARLGLDPDAPHVVVALRATPTRHAAAFPGATGTDNDDGGALLVSFIERMKPELPRCSAGAALSREIGAFLVPITPAMGPDISPAGLTVCEALVGRGKEVGWTVRASVGAVAHNVSALTMSARDAYDALRLGERVQPHRSEHSIDQLRIEQMLTAVPQEARERACRSLLGPLMEDTDWPAITETLRTWGEQGFNASKAADVLVVHRNTVSYRLEKVRQRSPAAASASPIALYLAAAIATMA